jgi:hypothetical protein
MGKFLPFLLISALGALLLTLFPVHVLSLGKEGKLVSVKKIRPGNVFSLGYLHSVEKSDVWERFIIDADYRIVLTETKFQGQAAGLPSALAPGERLTREGRWFRISGMARVLPHVLLRVDPQWHNRFQFEDEEEKDLSSMVGSCLLLIRVEKIRVWTWLGYQIRGVGPGKSMHR